MTQGFGRNGSSVGKNEKKTRLVEMFGSFASSCGTSSTMLAIQVGSGGFVAESSFNRGLAAFVYIRALSCLTLVLPSTDTVQHQATGLSTRCSQAKTLAAKSPSLWILGQNRRHLPVMRHCSAFGVRWMNHSLLQMPLLLINLNLAPQLRGRPLCS